MSANDRADPDCVTGPTRVPFFDNLRGTHRLKYGATTAFAGTISVEMTLLVDSYCIIMDAIPAATLCGSTFVVCGMLIELFVDPMSSANTKLAFPSHQQDIGQTYVGCMALACARTTSIR